MGNVFRHNSALYGGSALNLIGIYNGTFLTPWSNYCAGFHLEGNIFEKNSVVAYGGTIKYECHNYLSNGQFSTF